MPPDSHTEQQAAQLEAFRPRWRGQPARLEVWYATFSDPTHNVGVWIHHEIVSPPRSKSSSWSKLRGWNTRTTSASDLRPASGSGSKPESAHQQIQETGLACGTAARPVPTSGGPDHSQDPGAVTRGWVAIFENDRPPILERFGPAPVHLGMLNITAQSVPTPDGTSISSSSLAGTAGMLTWDFEYQDVTKPLFTFPRWAWRSELLPAAQVVVSPAASFSGKLVTQDRTVHIDSACGSVAHIYGHGNAERWGWLHADLGGGDTIEVVSAVARTPGLRAVGPLTLVQLRTAGADWPRDPLIAAPLFRSQLNLPTWKISGVTGTRRLRAEVTIPESTSITLGYTDPDGSSATCTNSELSDAEIILERTVRGAWQVEKHWTLTGSAHAEIGRRP